MHNPMMHCKLQQIDSNKTCCEVHNPFLVHFVSLISAHSTALIKYQQNHKYCETLRVYERKRERGKGGELGLTSEQSTVQRLLLINHHCLGP